MSARLKFLLVLFLAVCILVSFGQAIWVARAASSAGSPGISWAVLSAGGSPSSSGQVTLNATLGQPMVGASSHDTTVLEAGYWVGELVKWVRIFLPLVLK